MVLEVSDYFDGAYDITGDFLLFSGMKPHGPTRSLASFENRGGGTLLQGPACLSSRLPSTDRLLHQSNTVHNSRAPFGACDRDNDRHRGVGL
jgi:hypothetical protein